MARTQITGPQIEDEGVDRDKLDTTTPGEAVISKIIAGTGVTIESTGEDDGTGDVTINFEGGGGAGFTDEFSLNIKLADSNAVPTDADAYAIALAQSETNAEQSELVKLGLSGLDDSNAEPTDARSALIRVWLSGSAGSGVTNPANANGPNDGTLATISTAVLGDAFEIMLSALGTNVPSGITFSSAILTV